MSKQSEDIVRQWEQQKEMDKTMKAFFGGMKKQIKAAAKPRSQRNQRNECRMDSTPIFSHSQQGRSGSYGGRKIIRVLLAKEESIYAERADPFHNGYEPEHWAMADDIFFTSR